MLIPYQCNCLPLRYYASGLGWHHRSRVHAHSGLIYIIQAQRGWGVGRILECEKWREWALGCSFSSCIYSGPWEWQGVHHPLCSPAALHLRQWGTVSYLNPNLADLAGPFPISGPEHWNYRWSPHLGGKCFCPLSHLSCPPNRKFLK